MHIDNHAIPFGAAHRGRNHNQRISIDKIANAALILGRVARLRVEVELQGQGALQDESERRQQGAERVAGHLGVRRRRWPRRWVGCGSEELWEGGRTQLGEGRGGGRVRGCDPQLKASQSALRGERTFGIICSGGRRQNCGVLESPNPNNRKGGEKRSRPCFGTTRLPTQSKTFNKTVCTVPEALLLNIYLLHSLQGSCKLSLESFLYEHKRSALSTCSYATYIRGPPRFRVINHSPRSSRVLQMQMQMWKYRSVEIETM